MKLDLIRLGKNIQKHRQEAGLTQTELADLIGQKQQHIQRWESGQVEPRLTPIYLMAKAMNMDSPTELLNGVELIYPKEDRKMIEKKTVALKEKMEDEIRASIAKDGNPSAWLNKNAQEKRVHLHEDYVLRLFTPSGFSTVKMNLTTGMLVAQVHRDVVELELASDVKQALRRFFNPMWK